MYVQSVLIKERGSVLDLVEELLLAAQVRRALAYQRTASWTGLEGWGRAGVGVGVGVGGREGFRGGGIWRGWLKDWGALG